ncbi:porin family protein [Spirosoma litoris]
MKLKLCLLAISGLLSTQALLAQVQLGVKAGVNLATLKFDNPTLNATQQARTDFQGGFLVDVPITTSFSLQPALLISTKGTQINTFAIDSSRNPIATPITNSIKLLYVELPVLALFHFDVSSSLRLYGGLGPYLGLGIGGRISSTFVPIGEREVVFGSGSVGSNSFRRFDYGVSGAAGLEWHRLMAGVTYGYGLADLGSALAKSFHRPIGISVFFWLSRRSSNQGSETR